MRDSTPPGHVDTNVWCRVVGDELAIVAMSAAGAVDIARHVLSTPGNPSVLDEHYPHHPGVNHPHPPRPRPRTQAETDFLDIGDGAYACLVEAAASATWHGHGRRWHGMSRLPVGTSHPACTRE
jgi:hypothetical protein